MMKNDLRSLKQNPQKLKEAASTIDPNTIREVQSTIQKYNGKDKTELMEELRVMAAREREKGNLPDSQIDMIANALSAMLDENQRRQMDGIIQQIKVM